MIAILLWIYGASLFVVVSCLGYLIYRGEAYEVDWKKSILFLPLLPLTAVGILAAVLLDLYDDLR